MLTILVKTVVNTNNSTLAKESIADTNTNTAVEKYRHLPIPVPIRL